MKRINNFPQTLFLQIWAMIALVNLSLEVDSFKYLLCEERKYYRSVACKLYFEWELPGKPIKEENYVPYLQTF